jgi:putative endonuclease
MYKPWHWYVYIALCSDGSYYTGMTWDLHNRDQQHHSGQGSKYTTKHGYKGIIYSEYFTDFGQARYREKQIKSWSRKKKQKLISGEWSQNWDEKPKNK